MKLRPSISNPWISCADALRAFLEAYTYLFAEAVSRPEVAAPNRPRVFTSAVTSDDDRDRGRPSAWSATVDKLASDSDFNGQFPRLFVLAAGNTDNEHAWSTYPASLTTNQIRDPAQAWNAITVGAYTNKVLITEADAQDYKPIADAGGLSPYTTTSGDWNQAWPLKPDVVFEGGNVGKDAIGSAGISSLHLLTTNNLPNQRLFTTTNATSAASALGARMAAQLMAAYPALRPETIRGLIVHSAEWTEATGTLVVLSDGVIRILQRHRQSGLTARESGGVLLGLRRGQHIEVVEASAPSVFDERGRFSFVRKSAKHQKLAKARWEQSNGTVDHVGEWHTHPQRHPSPSFLDVKEWQALQARRRDNSPMLGIVVGTKSLLVSIIYRSSLVRLEAIND